MPSNFLDFLIFNIKHTKKLNIIQMKLKHIYLDDNKEHL